MRRPYRLTLCPGRRADLTVALNGDGGDESFAGYFLRHLPYSWAEKFPLPAAISRALLALAEKFPPMAGESGLTYRSRKTLRILGERPGGEILP